MGAYYGLVNLTKKHKVSSYWKGCPPQKKEVLDIGRKLGWNMKTDEICSNFYENGFQWDNKRKRWSYKLDEEAGDEESGDDEAPVGEQGPVGDPWAGWSCYGIDGDGNLTGFDPTFFCN